MKNLSTYTFMAFNLPLYPNQIRAFRGAVVESVMKHKAVFEAAGLATDVFHNHTELVKQPAGVELPVQNLPDNQFRYPLIQYKIKHKKAAILGLGKGAQSLQLWMSLADEMLNFRGDKFSLTLDEHQHNTWKPGLEKNLQYFRLNKWLPLNGENFREWQKMNRLSDRVQLLEKLIWGHLWHALDGLGITIERKELQLFLSSIDMMSFKNSYGIKRLALDVTFACNLNIPEEIGLGQGVSLGFGKVQGISKKIIT
ncbi:CRISPR-associated endonuclease Cas6 [uncultured Cyclobacterium sp.]|uniref:CRISPR-associated endonuclease Cas6 n=1 Tax=uncultured Cyclobacterium sp. TaxID=453820 RepID=UPI0030ED6996|tara:strand:+ start:23 stop:784 length:762 start_codon:yes stop_codon:yes gene_type:complete